MEICSKLSSTDPHCEAQSSSLHRRSDLCQTLVRHIISTRTRLHINTKQIYNYASSTIFKYNWAQAEIFDESICAIEINQQNDNVYLSLCMIAYARHCKLKQCRENELKQADNNRSAFGKSWSTGERIRCFFNIRNGALCLTVFISTFS